MNVCMSCVCVRVPLVSGCVRSYKEEDHCRTQIAGIPLSSIRAVPSCVGQLGLAIAVTAVLNGGSSGGGGAR